MNKNQEVFGLGVATKYPSPESFIYTKKLNGCLQHNLNSNGNLPADSLLTTLNPTDRASSVIQMTVTTIDPAISSSSKAVTLSKYNAVNPCELRIQVPTNSYTTTIGAVA